MLLVPTLLLVLSELPKPLLNSIADSIDTRPPLHIVLITRIRILAYSAVACMPQD